MTKNKIRMYRAANGGMTQTKIADAIGDGMSASAFCYIEKGIVLPTKSSLETMCKLLRCEKTELYAAQDLDLLSLAGDPQGGEQGDGLVEFCTWMRWSEMDALKRAVAELGYANSTEWFKEMMQNAIERSGKQMI